MKKRFLVALIAIVASLIIVPAALAEPGDGDSPQNTVTVTFKSFPNSINREAFVHEPGSPCDMEIPKDRTRVRTYTSDQEKLGKLPFAYMHGYQLEGWYTSQAYDTEVTADTPVPTKDTTYYAKFKPLSQSKLIIQTGDHGYVVHNGTNKSGTVDLTRYDEHTTPSKFPIIGDPDSATSKNQVVYPIPDVRANDGYQITGLKYRTTYEDYNEDTGYNGLYYYKWRNVRVWFDDSYHNWIPEYKNDKSISKINPAGAPAIIELKTEYQRDDLPLGIVVEPFTNQHRTSDITLELKNASDEVLAGSFNESKQWFSEDKLEPGTYTLEFSDLPKFTKSIEIVPQTGTEVITDVTQDQDNPLKFEIKIKRASDSYPMSAAWASFKLNKENTSMLTFAPGENGTFSEDDTEFEFLAQETEISNIVADKLPTPVANDGYQFAGWKVNDEEELLDNDALLSRTVSADTTITAVFEETPIDPVPENATLIFKTDGNGKLIGKTEFEFIPHDRITIEEVLEQQNTDDPNTAIIKPLSVVNPGLAANKLPQPAPKPGYKFAGWKYQNENELLTSDALLKKEAEDDLTITAIFNKQDATGKAPASKKPVDKKKSAIPKTNDSASILGILGAGGIMLITGAALRKKVN